jgi:hypothetical protein
VSVVSQSSSCPPVGLGTTQHIGVGSLLCAPVGRADIGSPWSSGQQGPALKECTRGCADAEAALRPPKVPGGAIQNEVLD